jgi:hypothetical protein
MVGIPSSAVYLSLVRSLHTLLLQGSYYILVFAGRGRTIRFSVLNQPPGDTCPTVFHSSLILSYFLNGSADETKIS